MSNPACFNCENGELYLGKHGRYCPDCDTFLPTGQADELAKKYFAATEINDSVRAAEIKIQLDYLRAETIESLIRHVGERVRQKILDQYPLLPDEYG